MALLKAAKFRINLLNLDHKTIQLIPTFRSALKISKPVNVWQDKYREVVVSWPQIGTFSIKLIIIILTVLLRRS